MWLNSALLEFRIIPSRSLHPFHAMHRCPARLLPHEHSLCFPTGSIKRLAFLWNIFAGAQQRKHPNLPAAGRSRFYGLFRWRRRVQMPPIAVFPAHVTPQSSIPRGQCAPLFRRCFIIGIQKLCCCIGTVPTRYPRVSRSLFIPTSTAYLTDS